LAELEKYRYLKIDLEGMFGEGELLSKLDVLDKSGRSCQAVEFVLILQVS
jgi:hypothetical protein